MTRERTPIFYGPEAGSVKELAALTAYLDGRSRSDVFTRLAALFSDDFAAFMAVFQGESFEVPTRMYLERTAFYCRVWLYVTEEAREEEDALAAASVAFNLPKGRVEAICQRIEKYLERRAAQEAKKRAKRKKELKREQLDA